MKTMIRTTMTSLAVACMGASAAVAAEPKVLNVTATQNGMGWRIEVTLEHPDETWEHYADAWDVEDGSGKRLGIRVLHHPHDSNQPFTRSLSNVMVPDGVREVFIRTKCSRDGWGDDLYRVPLDPGG